MAALTGPALIPHTLPIRVETPSGPLNPALGEARDASSRGLALPGGLFAKPGYITPTSSCSPLISRGPYGADSGARWSEEGLGRGSLAGQAGGPRQPFLHVETGGPQV